MKPRPFCAPTSQLCVWLSLSGLIQAPLLFKTIKDVNCAARNMDPPLDTSPLQNPLRSRLSLGICIFHAMMRCLNMLEEHDLFFDFHEDDDNACEKEYDTNTVGRFICHNRSCPICRWSSKMVAITIRMYPGASTTQEYTIGTAKLVISSSTVSTTTEFNYKGYPNLHYDQYLPFGV